MKKHGHMLILSHMLWTDMSHQQIWTFLVIITSSVQICMFKFCSIALDCFEHNFWYFATVTMILCPLLAFEVELMPSSLLRPIGDIQHFSHLIQSLKRSTFQLERWANAKRTQMERCVNAEGNLVNNTVPATLFFTR